MRDQLLRIRSNSNTKGKLTRICPASFVELSSYNSNAPVGAIQTARRGIVSYFVNGLQDRPLQ